MPDERLERLDLGHSNVCQIAILQLKLTFQLKTLKYRELLKKVYQELNLLYLNFPIQKNI